MESPSGSNTDHPKTCGECSTPNVASAHFCKSCGASIQAPSKCPKCEVEVEPDANFCAGCGTKLVGARPPPKNGATAAPVAPPAQAAPAKDVLEEEKAKLPAAKPPSSNMMGNVALFAAALIGMIAIIVFMNKDKPKEVSPFQGGPAMNAAPPPPPPAATGGTEAAAPAGGDPITGRITLSEANAKDGSGIVFIVLRNAGMPNRGPPIAVKKYDSPTFPLTFEISKADVMMKEMPFLGPFDIYVRLDKDGNAMTKNAGDLINASPAAGIAAGTKQVEIVLDKRL